jgi:hypothetical protein
MTEDVDVDVARHQLVQALTRATDPDVVRYLDAAAEALGIEIETCECPRCERPVAERRLD